ncbi:MAG: type II CAAX endopeptidase family protein [Candidatus Saccharibacteria bacterium]
MLQKYSKWLMLIAIPAWVVVSFFAAQALVLGLVWVLVMLKVPLASMNDAILNATSTALIYVITLALIIGVPWFVKKQKVSLVDLGLHKLPTWMDILITPAGLVVYLLASALLITLATSLVPGFDANQVQDVGFSGLTRNYEFIAAFVVLVIAVPVSEEVLFRGYLFGKLKKIVPVWAAVLVTSVLFGMLHGNWNVAVDTIALSVVLCVLRQITDSLWPSILLHMAKNGIAYYFLFINTSFLTTIGR